MIKYVCDWCNEEFAFNCITTVKLTNVYNEPVELHICRNCGKSHMPDSIQPMISWTANN